MQQKHGWLSWCLVSQRCGKRNFVFQPDWPNPCYKSSKATAFLPHFGVFSWEFRAHYTIFWLCLIFLACFLFYAFQCMHFMLIPMLIRTCEKPFQEGKLDRKLLALLGYCFFSQLLFPNNICQFMSPDLGVIIAHLSNKSWFIASNRETFFVEK